MASQTEISIEFTSHAAKHHLFFTQIGIHRIGELVELHFSYSTSSEMFGGVIIVVEKLMLEGQKASFVKYLKQIGLPSISVDANGRVREPQAVLFADVIGLARHGEFAEISFHAFSWKAAVDAGKKAGGKARADAVALLRAPLELQRNWISLLYAS